MKTLLLVGLGGAIGSILRYLTTHFISNRIPALSFPLGTFAVNIIGCLLIGIVYGLFERYDWFTPQLRILLAVGVCGSYTTFSAFAFENVRLMQDSNYITSFAYIITSVVVCIIATFVGITITKI